MNGNIKISQLPALTVNGSEVVPVVQDDGLGNLTTGQLPITDFGTDTNFANTDLTLTANRTHDFASYDMTFNNAHLLVYGNDTQAIYANNSGSGIGVVGVANTGTAINGSSTSGNGVSGSSTNSNGVTGASVNSKGGAFRNQVLVEEYTVANEVQDASSLFEVKSTLKGALLPRMTTTQRDAISSPATGLEIYNTTTGRKEVYNGSFWRGISMRMMPIFHGQFNPTDGQTVAFGQSINAPTVSTNAYYEIIMRGAGVIRGCDLNMLVGGTTGTNENWSLYVRHNGTDYLVATVGATTVVRNFNNTSMNIPYVDGDIVRMIYVNPTWATNPTAVTATGNLILL